MAAAESVPRIWDLIEEALAIDGASKLHLTVGRPPFVRLSDGGLHPLRDDLPILTWKSIQVMLCCVIDPDRWDRLEQVGEGEFRISEGVGKPITVSIFRAGGAWSAVVHL